MGIRVHKVIGYGIDDFNPRNDVDLGKWDNRWEDPWGGELTLPLFIEEVNARAAELYEYLLLDYPYLATHNADKPIKDRITKDTDLFLMELVVKHARKPDKAIYPIVQDGEFGLNNVLLLQPPDQFEWYRYDDAMDYLEETSLHKQLHRCEFLGNGLGIYPYDRRVIRRRVPEKANLFGEANYSKINGVICDEQGDPKVLPTQLYSQLTGVWEDSIGAIAKGRLLDHLKKDWTPQVPASVISLVVLCGLFKNCRDIINRVRPMLYVYWS